MSELRALLQTDLVDSTRLSEELGDAAMGALSASGDRAARDLLRRWSGIEIDKSDGFLLLFASASDAAGYALDYHRALAALSPALKARVGLHVGPVTLRENPPRDVARGAKPLEVEGLAKPVTARVMSLALGGQTLLTAEARAALGATSARIEPRGHWRVKGVEEPLELFEIGDADAPFTPPADSAKVYRVVRSRDLWLPLREIKHSLPGERDSFIGRHEPLHTLSQWFDSEARLISVLGMGGTGKTRLAQRFGWVALGDFPGGVWFCDLSQARDLDGLLNAVAQGLGVPLGRSDPVVQLGAALAGRGRCLLILDNFEQVSGLAEQTLGLWFERTREACFLVTSREVLGLVGEHVLALEPLTPAEGAALFRQRASATGNDLQETVDDTAAIEQLARLLDGLPLAIELAAARARVMTPSMLLQRMGERFTLLTSRSGRLDRQATLRAAFDWSWDLLSVPEKAALAQLSVFDGRITLEAAEVALDLSEFAGAPGPLDALQSLVEKSLVRHRSRGRFDLLGTVQDYAAEHLRTIGRYPGSGPGAVVRAHARHAAFFAALGARGAIADGCADFENLIAATRRAAAAGDAAEAVSALEGAAAALKLRGPFRLGIELAEAVRAMSQLAPALTSRVDLVGGWALHMCGRVAEAAVRFEAALAAAAVAGDSGREARAMIGLGNLHYGEGRVEQTRIELTRGLALARASGDHALACGALNDLGVLEADQSNFNQARTHLDAALEVSRRAGDRRWEGGSLGNLGMICANQGKMAEAGAFYAAALTVAREVGDRQFEGNSLCNLGLMHHVQGKLTEARAELDAALAVARELGHARLECIVLCNLGLVVEALRAPEVARCHYESALAAARELGDRRTEGQVLGYLGLLHSRQRRFDEGRDCLRAGERLLLEVTDRLNLGLLYCGRAESEYLAGAAASARDALAAATSIAREVGAESESELGVSLERVSAILALAPPTE